MPETILVTGGTGYLGGRIANHLAAAGTYAIRIPTRRRPEDWPAWSSNMEIITADIGRETDFGSLLDGVSAVIHLAAMNEIDCARDPVACVEINCVASARLIEAAKTAGVGRFIYMSTARAYGDELTSPVDETTVPRPSHPYGITHRLAEDFVLAAHDRKEFVGVVLRLAAGFGAPSDAGVDRWTLVANDLCKTAVEKEKLILKSPGLQHRDFITLADICRAVEHFLTLPEEQVGDGLFNLGTGNSIPIYEMAQRIQSRFAKIFGREIPLERPEPGPDDRSIPLDFRIDKLLRTGFEPDADFGAEIDNTLLLCQEAFARK